MPEDRDAVDDESPPRCPSCDGEVTGITVVGITEAYLSPCGCPIAPGLLATPGDE